MKYQQFSSVKPKRQKAAMSIFENHGDEGELKQVAKFTKKKAVSDIDQSIFEPVNQVDLDTKKQPQKMLGIMNEIDRF